MTLVKKMKYFDKVLNFRSWKSEVACVSVTYYIVGKSINEIVLYKGKVITKHQR